MDYPSQKRDQLKYWVWKAYTPLHPLVRNASYRLGVGRFLLRRVFPEMKQTGRQDFLIGTLDPAHSVRDFVSFLIEQGFGNHFVAWKDSDELVSLRRTDGFRHQYHIRIFKDGEVRCHYEFTPEYHPIRHLIRIGFEDRNQEFRTLMQDWLLPLTR